MKEDVSLLQFQILLSLRSKALTGYGIKKFFKEKFKKEISSGSLYPSLRRLESMGFISGRWVSNGRRRKIYEVTNRGLDTIEKTLNRILRFRDVFTRHFKEIGIKIIDKSKLKGEESILLSTIPIPWGIINRVYEEYRVSIYVYSHASFFNTFFNELNNIKLIHNINNLNYDLALCIFRLPENNLLTKMVKALKSGCKLITVCIEDVDNIWIKIIADIAPFKMWITKENELEKTLLNLKLKSVNVEHFKGILIGEGLKPR